MLKILVTTSALIALLTTVPETRPYGTQPGSPTEIGQSQPTTAPKLKRPGAGAPAVPGRAAGDQAAALVAPRTHLAATDKFLGRQQARQMLASSIIGQTVYDLVGNDVGSVKDIVVGKDGSMAAIVVAVGGFLGIGKQSVAVSTPAVSRTTDKDGKLRLVLNASKDEIDGAPAFASLADVDAKARKPIQLLLPAGDTLSPAPSAALASPSSG